MRRGLVCWILIWVGSLGPLPLDAVAPAAGDYSLILRYSSPSLTPSEVQQQQLLAKALALLASSNFNSAQPRWKWDSARIEQEYGRAVSGRHLLIDFRQPTVRPTRGGELSVRQIVIGLDGGQLAQSLHTLDPNGSLVGHAMYAGELCVELMATVRAMEKCNSTTGAACR